MTRELFSVRNALRNNALCESPRGGDRLFLSTSLGEHTRQLNDLCNPAAVNLSIALNTELHTLTVAPNGVGSHWSGRRANDTLKIVGS